MKLPKKSAAIDFSDIRCYNYINSIFIKGADCNANGLSFFR